MRSTLVVHCKREAFDVAIGRHGSGCHYGNPFGHKRGTLATVIVGTRAEAVACFRQWLYGTAWGHIEPDRRRWILETVHQLKDKRLGCWCYPAPDKPYVPEEHECHGEVLVEFTLKTPQEIACLLS